MSSGKVLVRRLCMRAFLNGVRGYSSGSSPRRAVMYVPLSDKRKAAKAPSLGADTVVFDLEDGVALNSKELARANISGALTACTGASSELVVRVNGLASGLLETDLANIFLPSSPHPTAIMLPKCDTAEQLLQLDHALAYHTPSPVDVLAIIESPLGLLNLREICQVSCRHLRLSAIVLGSDDYLAAVGGTRTKTAAELLYARQSLVTHAKAYGLHAIDLVDIDYKDLDGLRTQCEEGARMGFTGKQVIHPDQVSVVQDAFSPSAQQREWATELIAAFTQHQESGKGAFVFRGHMIDKPLLLQAQNTVRLANVVSKE